MSRDGHGGDARAAGPPVPAARAALRANPALDRARVLARVAAPDNLVWQDEHLLFSSGRDILVIDDVRAATAVPEPILRFDAAVSALAGAPDGSLAVGLGAAGVRIVGGARDGLRIVTLGGQRLGCPTALCFATPDVLFVCQGSAAHPPQGWRRDLLARGSDGSVWRLDLGRGDAVCLGAGLAFPNGILLLEPAGRIAVSESWRQRLLVFDATRPGAPQVVSDRLPGYPGRLAPARGEGAWLAVFARPAPAGDGALACSLAVRLDRGFRPLTALHGGAGGGGWAGIGSCLEVQGDLLLACPESDALIVSDLPRRRSASARPKREAERP